MAIPTKSATKERAVKAALDGLRHTVRALRMSAGEAERETGLSGAQIFVLRALDEGGALSLGEVAAKTLTDPSSASVVVQKLSLRALVDREVDPEDRRRVKIAITAAGRRAVRKSPDIAQTRIVAALRSLPLPTLRTLAASLAHVAATLGARPDGRAPLFFEDDPATRTTAASKAAARR